MNKILLFYDFVICLPFTLLRYLIIYFCGSKYNVNNFSFLDVMAHADKPYFNQQLENPTIDTIKDDIRNIIQKDTRIYENIDVSNEGNETKININAGKFQTEEKKNDITIDDNYNPNLEESILDTDAVCSDDFISDTTEKNVDTMLENEINNALEILDTTINDTD